MCSHSFVLFTYEYSTTLVELHKHYTTTKLHIVYHNIFLMSRDMSKMKYESTGYLCTLVEIQSCQSIY